ncbi:MAG: PVC-type heme-binding CxxCH protein [Mariniblastus sp.]
MTLIRFAIALLLVTSFGWGHAFGDEDKPHAVFVVGTRHYSPERSMPLLASHLEKLGFKTTILECKGNPEKNPDGIEGLEALDSADVAIFFVRFLTLPAGQLEFIDRYLKSGKPIVGFRTSSHAFAYPKGSEHFDWNDGFGLRALGVKYEIHIGGKTTVSIAESGKKHPLLAGINFNKPRLAAGTLYLTTPPPNATVLLNGVGKSKKVGKVNNAFGTHVLTETMEEPVAWVLENEYGGKVFATTLGHWETFNDSRFVRLFLNGICWTTGIKIPPRAEFKVDGLSSYEQEIKKLVKAQGAKQQDAKNIKTNDPLPPEDPDYKKYGIYANTAPRAKTVSPGTTSLPILLKPRSRIALVGNTLFERAQNYGYFETFLLQSFPEHELVVRNLGWSADTSTIQPRPSNFADQDQHLTHEKADVIFVAYGFNESFKGLEGLSAFREELGNYLKRVRAKAFNGTSAPQLILVSPVACENIKGVNAGDLNNENVALYAAAMKEIADELKIGFVDVYQDTLAMANSSADEITSNGVHLNQRGYEIFSRSLLKGAFNKVVTTVNEDLRTTIIDKNRQYFRRYRPLNTFYYTGGRNKSYGYLDFLPAMKNFDLLVENRERRAWALAAGKKVPDLVDDSNLPPLPKTKTSRGANRWMSAADEQKAFKVDPRFDLNLFASEEEFPDIAAPIQMRWDSRGRLWVSCSTTYPHVYPGNEPNDKLVILEDVDGDGKADTSSVFADNLDIPLSFEFGDGGVYVSESPHLTFLKDTNNDGKADDRKILLSGFGTEDSHHALHDFIWTPDGDLIFRESIFHHSQIETPYGPVRQQNSGWFRFDPKSHRLTSFGTYHSTNPWGVTFDDWGQHMASHPVYAAAFHSLDPPYPTQHQKPAGLQAYSGTCGQEFVDFTTFPEELRGHFIKARYKPTNRIEILKWNETPFGFEEKYVSDLIFSSNLSFIPVDLRFGPRGAMYVCDWYNPVKGHAQYSLRDERRDRHSGRIWRITAKGKSVQSMPAIFGSPLNELLDLLKRPEFRIRYLAKQELRKRDSDQVVRVLDQWVANLDPEDPRFRHHQLEALWCYRTVHANGRGLPQSTSRSNTAHRLLRDLLSCDLHQARAAAVEQLRFWHFEIEDALDLISIAANDTSSIVRMQVAICCSYIGTTDALEILLQTLNLPAEKHVAYAIQSALNSHTLQRHWKGNPNYSIDQIMKRLDRTRELKEPTPNAQQAQYDSQRNLKTVNISCIPERMLFSVNQVVVKTGQPLKVIFTNPDATDHNLVFVQSGALEEVGMAANEMARDAENANSDFIPSSKAGLILNSSPMIGPTRKSLVHVMRFEAPAEPGIYPFVCTFPGHWVIMKGDLVVVNDLSEADEMIAAAEPKVVKEWSMEDFEEIPEREVDETVVMRGMQSFVKARCNQCHVVSGHGINLGPELTKISERMDGKKLLQQIIQPSLELNKQFQNHQFILLDGTVASGVIIEETLKQYKIASNLLDPKNVKLIDKDQIDEQIPSKISAMPSGMLDVLTRDEILDLISFLESGGHHSNSHNSKSH